MAAQARCGNSSSSGDSTATGAGGQANPATGSGGAVTAGTGGASTGSGGAGGSIDASRPSIHDAGHGTADTGAPDTHARDTSAPNTGIAAPDPPDSVVWNVDNLMAIGGKPISKTVGRPMVIDTPAGKAIQFDGTASGGAGDALFVNVNPIASYARWTAEVIFRPDAGGAQAQRWFHMSEGLQGGNGNRVVFEHRVEGNNWFLVSFVRGGGMGRLYAVAFPHPLGAWYHVAIVVDGTTMKHYVNGVYENAGPCPTTEGCTPADVQMLKTPFPLEYKAMGAGGTSLGCRYTQQAFLKGAIRMARFTPRALTPAEFLPLP